MAAAAEQPVIFHDVESTIDNGFIGDVDSSLPSDSPPAAANTPHWLKKNVLPISLAFLALSAVVFASVVFRPGGPGNPNNIQSNLAAATRGAEVNGPSYMPTYVPTYFPTYLPTANNTDDVVPQEEIIPTPKPSFPTDLDLSFLSPTPPPSPFPTEPDTGAPTFFPTIGASAFASEQSSVTVSTETTGPPTTALRNETELVRM